MKLKTKKAPAPVASEIDDLSGIDLEELELAALEKIPADATEEEADVAYSIALRKLIAKKRRGS